MLDPGIFFWNMTVKIKLLQSFLERGFKTEMQNVVFLSFLGGDKSEKLEI